jgi:hypothetical protein
MNARDTAGIAIACALLMLASSFMFAEPLNGNYLIGQWRHVNGDKSGEIIFNRDGTYSGCVTQKGEIVWEFAGKWSVEGEILTYEYTRSSCENIPPGTKDQDRLLELAMDRWLVEAADGSRRSYRRVVNND